MVPVQVDEHVPGDGALAHGEALSAGTRQIANYSSVRMTSPVYGSIITYNGPLPVKLA